MNAAPMLYNNVRNGKCNSGFKIYKRNESNIKNTKFKIKVKVKTKQKYLKEESYPPVEGLKSKEDIERAKQYFLKKPERYKGQNIRNYCIFVVGINIARRCGDLLHLRFHNVLNKQHEMKSYINIIEQKTGKPARIIMTPVIKEALELYINTFKDIDLSDYLFPSRKKDSNGRYKAMTVNNFYKKMKDMQKELDISENMGTHSLRKTWGYNVAVNNKNDSRAISNISKALNHSNIETTFRYLGITQEEIDDTFMKNQL